MLSVSPWYTSAVPGDGKGANKNLGWKWLPIMVGPVQRGAACSGVQRSRYPAISSGCNLSLTSIASQNKRICGWLNSMELLKIPMGFLEIRTCEDLEIMPSETDVAV